MLIWATTAGGRQAQAQETAPPAEAAQAEEPAKPTPWSPIEAAGIAAPLKSWGLEIHGLLAANYTFNFNEPASGKNGLLSMNRKHDHFDLDLGNLRIQRVVDDGVGFVTDLDFGKTAEVVGRSTRWCENPRCSESRNSFELIQFYLTYTFPVGSGLSVMAGKFASPHGIEGPMTWDNINYNISHSIVDGFVTPTTHTGLLFNYDLTNWLRAEAGFTNGWDNVYDNNDGKSFLADLTITASSVVSFFLVGSVGPEKDNRGDSQRALVSLITTIKPTDKWTFIFDNEHGEETNVLPPLKPSGRGTQDARWEGVSGYAIYRFTDALSGTARAEFVDDVDGVLTGVQQTLWGITSTLAYQIYPGLTLRAEFRHDESNKRFFAGRALARSVVGGPTTRFFPGQDVVAWEVLYSF